jgi:hypothetical protein
LLIENQLLNGSGMRRATPQEWVRNAMKHGTPQQPEPLLIFV